MFRYCFAVAAAVWVCGIANAQTYRTPSTSRVAQYQDRFVNVYKAAGYTDDAAVKAMRDYFGTDYEGVDFIYERRANGDVDFIVQMIRDRFVVFYSIYATTKTPAPR